MLEREKLKEIRLVVTATIADDDADGYNEHLVKLVMQICKARSVLDLREIQSETVGWMRI